MNRLREVIDNVNKLDSGEILFDTLNDNNLSDYILDLNKLQIFRDGLTGSGDDLTSSNSTEGYYSKFTEELNQGLSFSFGGITKRKIAGDPYFLFDSGDYFKTFKIKLDVNGDFTISSKPTDFKDGDFGDLEGLTFNSIDELIEKITPIYTEKTRELILA